jgi:hypothetical protein
MSQWSDEATVRLYNTLNSTFLAELPHSPPDVRSAVQDKSSDDFSGVRSSSGDRERKKRRSLKDQIQKEALAD